MESPCRANPASLITHGASLLIPSSAALPQKSFRVDDQGTFDLTTKFCLGALLEVYRYLCALVSRTIPDPGKESEGPL